MATALIAIGFVAFAPHAGRSLGRSVIPVPGWLFLSWMLGHLVLAPSVSGLQQFLVMAGFICAVATLSRGAQYGGTSVKGAAVFGLGAAIIYLVTIAVDGLSADIVYTPRAYSLSAIVPLAIFVTTRRRGEAAIVVAAVLASLSRTATVLSILVIAGGLLWGRTRLRKFRLFVSLWASVVLSWAVAWSFTPLRERFFGGDAGLETSGMMLNTSGRVQIWEYLWLRVPDALFIGHGAGAASQEVAYRFPGVSHPHNEYLRIIFDYGLIGIVLFTTFWLGLILRVWRSSRGQHSGLTAGANLAMIALTVAAITDNVYIYPFVLFPLAVLVGSALAGPAPPPSDGRPTPVR